MSIDKFTCRQKKFDPITTEKEKRKTPIISGNDRHNSGNQTTISKGTGKDLSKYFFNLYYCPYRTEKLLVDYAQHAEQR